MSLAEKINRFFNGEDGIATEDYYDNNQINKSENEVPQGNQRNSKIMSIVGKNENIQKKIMLFEPRMFSDVKQISTRLLDGQATIVNFSRMDDQQAHRIVDFLSGVVFAINGDVKRIGEEIFLCTPADFSVEGMLMESTKIRDF
ncbi:cell division protein SepF [Ligilactobacillus sp. LYQ135]